MKTSIFCLCMLYAFNCVAQVESYTSTDNTGINKLERITVIEAYLQKLSGTLIGMEAKLNANDLKLKALEANLSALKEQDIKKIQDQLAQKKEVKPEEVLNKEELEKLKADILTLKNDDIEAIRQQIQILKAGVDELRYKKK